MQEASARLCNPGHSHINVGDFVPGGIVRDTGSGQAEDALEGTDGFRSGGTVDSVGGDGGDGGVVAGDAV